MKNPIKDNRIVRDETFATRLLKYLLNSQPEREYKKEKVRMLRYATWLLEYQIDTATSEGEKKTLKAKDSINVLNKGLLYVGNDPYKSKTDQEKELENLKTDYGQVVRSLIHYKESYHRSDAELESLNVEIAEKENTFKQIAQRSLDLQVELSQLKKRSFIQRLFNIGVK